MALITNTYLRYNSDVYMESSFENNELILFDYESYFDKYSDILFNEDSIVCFTNIKFNNLVSCYNKLIKIFVSKYFNNDDLSTINTWFISYNDKCKYIAIFEYVKIELIPIYVSNYIYNNIKLFVNQFIDEFELLYGNNQKLTYNNSIPLNKIHFSLYRKIISNICTFYVQIYFNIYNENEINSILRVLTEDYLQGVAFCKYETIDDIKKDIFDKLNVESIFYDSYLEFIDDLQIKAIVISNTFTINDLIINDKINYYIFKNIISRLNNEVLLHNLEYLMSKSINQIIHTIIENGKSYIIERVYADYLID